MLYPFLAKLAQNTIDSGFRCALDNRAQAIVQASLMRLGITRVVIAHRLSSIRDVDRIYVVDGGRIVESGRYDELMRRDGVFAALARRQLVQA